MKIIFKNHILLETLKYLFKSGNAIFRSSESFDGTRLGRQSTSDLIRGHIGPSFKGNLCDTLNLFSDTVVLNIIFDHANLVDPRDRTTFSLNLGIGHFSDKGKLMRAFAFVPTASQKAAVVTRRTCELTLDDIRASTRIR